jgi:hypothetical protein
MQQYSVLNRTARKTAETAKFLTRQISKLERFKKAELVRKTLYNPVKSSVSIGFRIDPGVDLKQTGPVRPFAGPKTLASRSRAGVVVVEIPVTIQLIGL